MQIPSALVPLQSLHPFDSMEFNSQTCSAQDAEGSIYLSSINGVIYKFDQHGKELWQSNTGRGHGWAWPADALHQRWYRFEKTRMITIYSNYVWLLL